MMKNMLFGLALLFMIFHLQISGKAIDNLIPGDDEIPGWKMTEKPGIFEGDNLFELIDGGADLYYEYGFMKVLSVHYADPANTNLLVEVYEMEDSQSAYGIFSITRRTSAWSDSFGSLAAIEGSYISFWKSRYYVTVSFTSGQQFDAAVLSVFAADISGRIPGESIYPPIIEKFRNLSQDGKTIFLEGNIALSNFYYFDYKNVFQLKQAAAGSADGYHWIIMDYPDSTNALAVVTDANQKVSANKRFSDVAMTFQGFSCRDNKGNNILLRQIGHYIAILVVKDAELQVVPLMDSISAKIENEKL
jgi:hypothetical protein